MNYKYLLLILFFLTSCTVQSTQYSENIFSNRGFVLLYDESLIEQKLLRKPLDDRSLEIVHNTLSKGTKVRIINLLNNKSTNAIVKTKNKNLFFYNSIFSKRIFDELDISLKEPYVEISKIRENKTFIADGIKTSFDVDFEGEITLGVRPDKIHIINDNETNNGSAKVYSVELTGEANLVTFKVNNQNLIVKTDKNTVYEIDSVLKLNFNKEDCYFFDINSEERLRI